MNGRIPSVSVSADVTLCTVSLQGAQWQWFDSLIHKHNISTPATRNRETSCSSATPCSAIFAFVFWREELHSFVECEWLANPDECYQRKMARLAVAASWGLGKWDCMDEYTCMIPREQYDGPFYRAVMAIHQNHFIQATEVLLHAESMTICSRSWPRIFMMGQKMSTSS